MHAFESCVEQLAYEIRRGTYPRGSMLPPERDLAVAMGVSRATLRDAIAALRTAKVVRTTRGRRGGTTITQAAPKTQNLASLDGRRHQDLTGSLTFSRVVEAGACAMAASRHLTPAQAQLLKEAERAAREVEDPAKWRQADSHLHLTIASLTESPALIAAVRTSQAALNDMLAGTPLFAINLQHSKLQHQAIVAAILGRHPDRARRAMEAYYEDTAALVRALLG